MTILGPDGRPATAEPRKRYRARHFEGAAKGRRTDGWRSPSTSANAALAPVLQTLVNRARDLARNNPWARRANLIRVRNTVGRGILPKFRGPEGQVERLRDLWDAWAGTLECSSDGRRTFSGIQSQVMRTIGESGEVLVRRRRRRAEDGLTVPLQLELLEPDFLDTAKDQNLRNGGQIFQGIEFDPIGRRVAYWLFREHPGETSIVTRGRLESRRVPASEILHVYDAERAGQVRGIPAGVTAFIRTRDYDLYEDAHLLRQRLAACYMAFVRDMEGADDPQDLSDDELLDKLEPGALEYLPPGKQVEFARPPGVEGYKEYTAGVLHAIAAGFDVTYEDLTGDYSQVNFSSARLGKMSFGKDVTAWQDEVLIPQLCQPALRWFLEAAALAGEPADDIKARWTPPRKEMVDPTKEVPARIKAIRAGLLSLPEALRQGGYDPDEVLAEIAETNELLDKLGLVLDSDPRHGKAMGDGDGQDGGDGNSSDGKE